MVDLGLGAGSAQQATGMQNKVQWNYNVCQALLPQVSWYCVTCNFLFINSKFFFSNEQVLLKLVHYNYVYQVFANCTLKCEQKS